MNYLIDTNVISELIKPKPTYVIAFVSRIPSTAIYMSSLT